MPFPAVRSRLASIRRWRAACDFWVRQQTGIELGLARQIGTLGDCSTAGEGPQVADTHVLSVCYLAPVRPTQCDDRDGAAWRSWYAYFPGRTGAAASPDA